MFDRVAYMKEYHKKHYALHRAEYLERAKQRQREKAGAVAEYKQAWRKRPDVAAEHVEDTRRQRQRWPEKWKARQVVQNAIKRGSLVQECCEVCGARRVHAHHEDYSKPLEVIWLCAKHHTERHKQLKPMPSATEGVQT